MISPAFKKSYSSLNSEQKLAVDTIQGPVMVIAGPGTGKTTILTLRIANILRLTDTPPECILALTFTESGAYAMRVKLAEIIGSFAYRVNVATFHGFANSLIQDHPDSFPRIIGSQPAGEIDQIKILEEIFRKNNFKILRPQGDIFYYVRPSLLAIRSIKKEGLNPTSFKKFSEKETHLKFSPKQDISRTKRLQRNKELVKVFALYEKVMRAKKLYDYEDMLLEAVNALSKDKTLLAEIRERTHYILADEHQDSNGAQNKLLELLSGFDDSPNLFIVGDEKQAIYRFQGASLENFLYFSRKFGKAVQIILTKSFRSGQKILDVSHSLMTKVTEEENIKRQKLLSNRKISGEHIEIHSYENEKEEAEGIAKIASNIVAKKSGQRVAILYRDNKDAEPIIKALRAREANFTVLSDRNVLNDSDIENFLRGLMAINDLSKEDSLGKFLFADFLILPTEDIFKIVYFADKRRKKIIGLLSDARLLREVGISKPEKFVTFGKNLEKWASEAKNLPLLDFMDKFVQESDFGAYILRKENPFNRLENFYNFYEIAREFAKHDQSARLSDFLNHLEIATSHGVKIGGETRLTDKSAPIILMTAHRAKGLEFENVLIARFDDSRWGVRRNRDLFLLPEKNSMASDTSEADERRLFYVAITRARDKVIISHANYRDDGKPIVPARFIEDLDPDLVKRLKIFSSKNHISLKPKPAQKAEKEKHLALLGSIFLEEGLTVTALNNFLECPWKFFFQNLIRLPKQPERHQIYGTAIHEALKRFQEEILRGNKPTSQKLTRLFELAIEKQPLSAFDFKILKERGINSLKQFFVSRGERYRTAIPEMKIGGVPIEFEGGKINLRGVIDLFVPIGGNKISVIDYKTGKPKSRNDIEGKTKGSGGDILRQLIFYKLLIEESRQDKGKVGEGSIVFVEPDEKGICRKETFFLEDRQVAELRQTIKEVSEKIYNLSFWNETCDEPDCEFCKLSKSLIRNV